MKTFLFISIFLLSGCASLLDSFYNRDVVQDYLRAETIEPEHEVGTLAVTAQRRLIIANLETGKFCSEPPPEAADSVTSAIAAALSANISDEKSLNAELASNFARHVNQLYKRTHTVQLFRDAAYHMCVDSVNSTDGKPSTSYKKEIEELVKNLLPVLEHEITLYYKTETARAKNPPQVARELVICDSTASVRGNPDSQGLTTNIDCHPVTTEESSSIHNPNSEDDSEQAEE